MFWQRGSPRVSHSTRSQPRTARLMFWGAPTAAALALSLTACAPASTAEPPAQPQPSGTASEEPSPAAPNPVKDAPADPAPEAAQTGAPTDCEWDVPALVPDLGRVPSGQEGVLTAVLPGAWQHVAIDTGAGYTDDLTADIRYVFPSTTDLIYCQDRPGVTDQAENRAAFELSGTEIVLPAPATGYAVQAWNQDSMVWVNHRDGSLYLLQRR